MLVIGRSLLDTHGLGPSSVKDRLKEMGLTVRSHIRVSGGEIGSGFSRAIESILENQAIDARCFNKMLIVVGMDYSSGEKPTYVLMSSYDGRRLDIYEVVEGVGGGR